MKAVDKLKSPSNTTYFQKNIRTNISEPTFSKQRLQFSQNNCRKRKNSLFHYKSYSEQVSLTLMTCAWEMSIQEEIAFKMLKVTA